jgi:hypothetical protein
MHKKVQEMVKIQVLEKRLRGSSWCKISHITRQGNYRMRNLIRMLATRLIKPINNKINHY